MVVNGGRDRRMKVGAVYDVRPQAQMVVDPDTGDILGHIAGEMIGSVRVTQVTNKYSMADILTGANFQPGQTLFLNDPAKPPAPVSKSIY